MIRVDSAPPDRLPARPHHHRRADRRLVELRRHPARGLPPAARHPDFSPVRVTPRLPCASCAATVVEVRGVRNVTPAGRGARVDRAVRRLAALRLGSRTIPRAAASLHALAARAQPAPVVAARPVLPARPSRSASAGALVGRWTGARPACARSASPDGRLMLNGRPVNLRGVGLHEDPTQPGLRGRQRVPRAAGRPRRRRSARR